VTRQQKFPALFSPLQVGRHRLKNRIMTAPMGSGGLDSRGYMSMETIAQYEILAKGGAGLVTIGESLVDSETGNNHGSVLRLDDAGSIPGIHKCTDAIHRWGAKASIELVHPGQRADPAYNADHVVYGPTGGREHYGDGFNEVVEMDQALIDRVVNRFAEAASMAEAAGCDGVMVHAGHGWLLSQFLAPATNHRTDAYGGSLENRARISIEVAKAIREMCGPGLFIDFRISGDDLMEGGFTLEEACRFAAMLEEAGVDMVHVSAATFHDRAAGIRMFPSTFHERGVNAYLAEAVRACVSIPVVAVGGLNDPAMMDALIADEKADGVALARALVADPMLPEKARLGRESDIAYCTRCNNCLSVGYVPYVKYNVGVSRCSVNPWHGLDFERLHNSPPSGDGNLKVLVIGGGPAGLMAALGAAECGHEVILAEASDKLGGMLNIASKPAFKADIGRFVDTMSSRIIEYKNIKVLLSTVMTPEKAKGLGADAIIACLGAKPIVPDIAGLESANVFWASKEHAAISKGPVAVIGGGQAGAEEAINLARAGIHVTVIEQADKLAADATYLHWLAIAKEVERLSGLIDLKLGYKATEITASGVLCTNAEGHFLEAEAASVLIACGMQARSEEAIAYEGAADIVITAGDVNTPSQMADAVLQGYFAGYSLERL